LPKAVFVPSVAVSGCPTPAVQGVKVPVVLKIIVVVGLTIGGAVM